MTTILIDGYNLLGKSNRKEREELIQDVVSYRRNKKMDIVIFFDGTHGGTRFGDTLYVENVKIVYTPLHETADDHMISMIEQNINEDLIIISSDRKIQNAAARHMYAFFSSEEFMLRLSSRTQGQNKDEIEPVYAPKKTTKKKGNPRKKSKKDRKNLSKLKKL
ncbi:MAG: NYN domain-containing protein [Bdellovibrionales bacterium]|nr:NYN domain-containing protein [Bdellovibrionales bacterium]